MHCSKFEEGLSVFRLTLSLIYTLSRITGPFTSNLIKRTIKFQNLESLGNHPPRCTYTLIPGVPFPLEDHCQQWGLDAFYSPVSCGTHRSLPRFLVIGNLPPPKGALRACTVQEHRAPHSQAWDCMPFGCSLDILNHFIF